MSRRETIQKAVNVCIPIGLRDTALAGDVALEVANAYDAGFLEGSGQSSITALEREVIVAALEAFYNTRHDTTDARNAAVKRLAEALEREATE
jgi:hypothetical protein